jgi:uncharacterized damage-inducible protein DinB
LAPVAWAGRYLEHHALWEKRLNRSDHIRLMANYNEWMNARLYEAAMGLTEAELAVDRKAFFGSILGTLNHLAVGDTIWLQRFAGHPANYPALHPISRLPAPINLDQQLFADIASLARHRQLLDRAILDWARSIVDGDLDHVLSYTNTRGVAARRNFFSLVMHFFNHQTHHRGQATTLLSQAGVDVGVTDLLTLIPNPAPS